MRWVFLGAAVVVGIGVMRFLARQRQSGEYLSERWLKAQSYDTRGQGWWV